jgi:hypothetical protein
MDKPGAILLTACFSIVVGVAYAWSFGLIR